MKQIPFLRLLSWLRRPLLFLAALVLLYWAATRFNWLPSPAGWFAAKPVLIDNTPLVVLEMRTIAELYTAGLYAEVVVDSTEILPTAAANATLRGIGLPTLPVPTAKTLVLIAKGQVKAGIPLGMLDSSRIQAMGDSVQITLPPAQILDVITNPSGFETFTEEGNWSEAARTQLKQKARQLLLAEAQRQQLTRKAEEQAQAAMEAFLHTVGFKKV
ncbi:MAG TPA: DUF4230 domain-containing protein, partial [Phnomibacter sp.]|nr:DUF4230 domain-containing protein [Phnomibacter sp.]